MRKIFFVLVMVFLSSVLVFSSAKADIIRVPEDYPTIQQGINASVDGDTVLVNDGLYQETINFLGKAITVRSVNGPDVTTIDGNQLGSVVTFENGEWLDSVIDGFTITNGTGTYINQVDGVAGGGIFCHPGGSTSPTIINNIITGNSVTGCGGGIYGIEIYGVFRNNIISNNSAGDRGGGICLRDVRVTTTIEGNTITQNNAGGSGGGIWILADGNPNILDNNITLNTTGEDGGGIYVTEWVSDSGYATIEDNIIQNNSASSDGGGIYSEVNATISNNTITENTAANSYGGGIFISGSDGIISNNLITKNSASNLNYNQGGGGGIVCKNNSNPTIINNTISENFAFSTGGGIFCWSDSCSTIENNLISKNSTDLNYYWADGGGIAFNDDCDSIIKNNIIAENSSVYGGGISSSASSHLISNNLFYKNSAVKRGGGIDLYGFIFYGDTFILRNNTLDNNTAVEMGGAIYCRSYGNITQTNDILWNNDAPLGPEIALGWGSSDEITFTTSYSDVEGGESQVYINPYGDITLNWGLGMIDLDPLFINADVGHYSLSIDSSCIDSGNPTILDPDDTVSNMGVFGGPNAKIVNLTLVPLQIQIPRGGTLEYTALLSNNFSDSPSILGGSEVVLPNGNPYPGNPILGPLSITLNPYQTIQPQISHDIPNNAPLGNYVYTGKVGNQEYGIIDESGFGFEVISGLIEE